MRNIGSEKLAVLCSEMECMYSEIGSSLYYCLHCKLICVSKVVPNAQRFAVKGTYCKERSYNCTQISHAAFYICILLLYLNNRN